MIRQSLLLLLVAATTATVLDIWDMNAQGADDTEPWNGNVVCTSPEDCNRFWEATAEDPNEPSVNGEDNNSNEVSTTVRHRFRPTVGSQVRTTSRPRGRARDSSDSSSSSSSSSSEDSDSRKRRSAESEEENISNDNDLSAGDSKEDNNNDGRGKRRLFRGGLIPIRQAVASQK
ncbi:hypothetical protein BsWGS_17642 [Bradybaena similaris]